jgi:hypothetical protein
MTFLEAGGRQKDVGYNSRHITNGKLVHNNLLQALK